MTEESDAGSLEGATVWEGAAFLGEVVAGSAVLEAVVGVRASFPAVVWQGAAAIWLTFDGLTCEASASSPEANPNVRMNVHKSDSCLADGLTQTLADGLTLGVLALVGNIWYLMACASLHTLFFQYLRDRL